MLDLVLQFDEKLDCGVCENALVWIQNPLKLAVNHGVTNPDDLKYLVEMHIKDVTCANSASWYYTFEYDEDILEDSDDSLLECDVKKVCCAGCFLEWLKEHPSAAPCVTDSNTIDFEIDEDGCITGDVNISADEGNIIEARVDGLYAAGGGGGGDAWLLLGNAGTVDGLNKLGTTDDVNLTIVVNDLQVARFISAGIIDAPPKDTCDIIMGNPTNEIFTDDGHGHANAILSGGYGNTGSARNRILGDEFDTASSTCVIVGGAYNAILRSCANSVIGGGDTNTIGNFEYAGVICGGISNLISCTGDGDFIGAGTQNSITATDQEDSIGSQSVICGGATNLIEDQEISFIGGGGHNSITGSVGFAPTYNVLVGGHLNTITDSLNAFIGGGEENSITDSDVASIVSGSNNSILVGFGDHIGGGYLNVIDGTVAGASQNTIGGGTGNIIINTLEGELIDANTIAGGDTNLIQDGFDCNVAGGYSNQVLSATACAIVGGSGNLISGTGFGTAFTDIAEGCFIGGGGSHSGIPGASNTIESSAIGNGPARWSNIVGGSNNHLLEACLYTSILGGQNNYISWVEWAAIIGGHDNFIHSVNSNAEHSWIGCGHHHTITDADRCTILNGDHHLLTDTGYGSTILGGSYLKLGTYSVGFNHGDLSVTQTDSSAFDGIGLWCDIDTWIANTTGTAAKLKFLEPNTDFDFSSTNYTSIEAQAQGANMQLILPAAAGVAGQQLTIDTVVGTTITLKWA